MYHGIEWEIDRIHGRIRRASATKTETESRADAESEQEPVTDAWESD